MIDIKKRLTRILQKTGYEYDTKSGLWSKTIGLRHVITAEQIRMDICDAAFSIPCVLEAMAKDISARVARDAKIARRLLAVKKTKNSKHIHS